MAARSTPQPLAFAPGRAADKSNFHSSAAGPREHDIHGTGGGTARVGVKGRVRAGVFKEIH